MTIKTASAPSGARAVIGDAIAHLASRSPGELFALGGRTGGLQLASPIQVFSLKLEDIDGRDFLGKAFPIGWRYLILDDGPIAAADVRAQGPEGGAVFSSLIRGRLAERLRLAADFAERQYQGDPANYEARILDVPALYVSALWLHGPRDLFIPYLTGVTPEGAEPREDPEFLARLEQDAIERRREGAP